MHNYDTVTAALNGLKERGFKLDFNVSENLLLCGQVRYDVNDFEIVELYRFEGDSDPADEAVVYGVLGKDGQKGTLVTGYGPSAEGVGAELSKKLSITSEQG